MIPPKLNILWKLALGLWAVIHFFASAQTADVPPEAELAQLVEVYASELGGKILVVYPFSYTDGVTSVEGSLFAERLETLLAERGRVRVVDRAQLDRILEEQKLTAAGLVSAETGARVGKLLGARGVVSGTVTDLGEKLEVHARLTNVETGELVTSFSASMRKTIKTFISPLWNRIERIKKESPSFGIELWAGDDETSAAVPGYPIGDFVTFHFRVERDCYVTLFDFTTSGSINILFPNALMPDNHVTAGRTYTVPGPQDGFRIRVKGPAGIERLKLFATTKDVPLFQEDYAVESFRSVTDGSYDVSRDLEAVLDSLGENRWGESHLELRIEQPLRGE